MTGRVRRQRISARALVLDSGRILLARISPRAYAGAGAWTLPGGGVDHGEHPEDTLLREVLEETGMEVRLDGIIGVFSRHFVGRAPNGVLEDYHGVHLIFRATPLDPTQPPRVLEVEGTTDDTRWIPVDDVREGTFPVSDVVRYALSLPVADD